MPNLRLGEADVATLLRYLDTQGGDASPPEGTQAVAVSEHQHPEPGAMK